MTTLTDQALESAKAHITKFYDSAFFPKPREFDALWYNWGDVKKELLSKNIQKFYVTPPRTFPVPKPSGDFRIVHQLHPLEAVIYSALAFQIANDVEAARMPRADKVACSYRFDLKDGSYFSGGAGYRDFIEKTEELAAKFELIYVTDITDFYNQIYLHRLSNAIEYAESSKKALGDDIEKFITNMNAKASQGIPVGPAGSIVMAEAVLMDVDGFLKNQGVQHTRYVDDFRIFSNSADKLVRVQQDLSLYLYEHHRLTLSGPKSTIDNAAGYVEKKLHNPYAEEKIKLFKSIEVFNHYTEEVEEFEFEVSDEHEVLIARLEHIVKRILEFDRLDLGLARTAIRRAKRYGITNIAAPILENFSFFAPVINDVVLYFEGITSDDLVEAHYPLMVDILGSPAIQLDIVRFWLEWYFAGHASLLAREPIRNFVAETPNFVNRAKMAITEADLSWVRDQKTKLFELGSWERRALLDAARVLPSDEREHWLRLTESSTPVLIDRWTAKWVRESS